MCFGGFLLAAAVCPELPRVSQPNHFTTGTSVLPSTSFFSALPARAPDRDATTDVFLGTYTRLAGGDAEKFAHMQA